MYLRRKIKILSLFKRYGLKKTWKYPLQLAFKYKIKEKNIDDI